MILYCTVQNERRGREARKGADKLLTIELSKKGIPAYTIVYNAAGLTVFEGGDIRYTTDNAQCAYCGENMYTQVRAHHHTENGKDVTKGK